MEEPDNTVPRVSEVPVDKETFMRFKDWKEKSETARGLLQKIITLGGDECPHVDWDKSLEAFKEFLEIFQDEVTQKVLSTISETIYESYEAELSEDPVDIDFKALSEGMDFYRNLKERSKEDN